MPSVDAPDGHARESQPLTAPVARVSYYLTLAWLAAAAVAITLVTSCDGDRPTEPRERALDPALVAEGKEIFRFDTFGDEQFWTDTLRMHEVIQQAVTPAVALSVGLKVDADALRSEEHTSELQSRQYLVCRLLLEKKKKKHHKYDRVDMFL